MDVLFKNQWYSLILKSITLRISIMMYSKNVLINYKKDIQNSINLYLMTSK